MVTVIQVNQFTCYNSPYGKLVSANGKPACRMMWQAGFPFSFTPFQPL